MIFFRHPRVKFALFFDAIRNNLAPKSGGTKAIKFNISQRSFVFLGVILTSEGTQKSTIRKHHFTHSFTKSIYIIGHESK